MTEIISKSTEKEKTTFISTDVEGFSAFDRGDPWGKKMTDFAIYKEKFDETLGKNRTLKESLVTVNGEIKKDIPIKNEKGDKIEEYYKWQFVYSIINSGLYSKDYLGCEVHFPKGSKGSIPIKIDCCIFDNKSWIDYYIKWKTEKDNDAIEWLRNHLIGIVEFKKPDQKDVKDVFIKQIKPYLKESEKEYCLGFYYDSGRLYIFEKNNGRFLRYDQSKNQKEDKSTTNDLSLELPDGYYFIPSHEELVSRINKSTEIDRSKRTVDDLDIITGVYGAQINNAISNILRTLDKVGLSQRGYEILIQMLALKIFDEKRSERYKKYLKFYATHPELEKLHLLFYITESEKSYVKLSDENIQSFIKRIRKLYNEASEEYKVILPAVDTETIVWENESHISAICSIVENLQDYSFIRSYKTDLYQLVFYRFANAFTKAEKAQFVTPLQLIDFLVQIVNPRGGETVIDPTVGIADFLSMSYVNSKRMLDDKHIYGVDNDEQMIRLAQLNMLLNGDGNAILKYKPDKGSIRFKFNTKDELIKLDVNIHKNGNWDEWLDGNRLKKFDVVLTNPPFGEDRKFEPKTDSDKKLAECYELWNIARVGNWIDPGLLFLENAYRILNTNGRLGIVLSNSIASIDRWKKAREWLLDKMRVVATFDLPENVFADTGVNTTLVVAYKPTDEELQRLKKENYEIFSRDIKNVGYEIRTSKRVKFYNPVYKIDEESFEVMIDENGRPLLDEDFTQIVKDFREWVMSQEETLKKLFMG
jgi:type I restriction enzyme M protein